MNIGKSPPYAALEPLAPAAYREVWRETVFRHGKWDPQIGDTAVLADFPLLLAKAAWQEVAGLAERLAAEALAVELELTARTDLHRMLALPKAIRNAWRTPARVMPGTAQDARIIRFDFHYTAEGWRISEANIDTPGGWIEASGFSQAMQARYAGTQLTGDPPAALAKAIGQRVAPGTLVALIHATAYTDDRQMLVYFARLLELEGLRGCLISPAQLSWQAGRVAVATDWESGETGYLVRFFPAEWLPNLPAASRWERYFNDCRIPASNPTSALLVQGKRFPLVWDELATPLPTWRALLPETRDLRATPSPENGHWVIKPAFGRDGEDVTIRGVTPEQEWTKTVRQARRDPGNWIAQRRFETIPVSVNDSRWYPCIGVYTVDGRAAGIYGRAAAQPLINDTAKDLAVLIEQ